MSTVMIIAGGKWQCPLVKLAKKQGHFVICTNLYENSPAFEFSDVAIIADVLDKEKNLEIAKQYKPDVVVTAQSDISVPTVAYVAEKMGLRGIGINIADRFTNKYIMREVTAKAGFASPQYMLCHTIEEAVGFVKKVNPSIIKPLDSQSSRGVHIVYSSEDVESNWEDCIKYSSTDKAVIIEEYIEGVEFTVDGLKTQDEYIVTAISEKEHYDYNPNVASRLFFAPNNDKYDYDKLRHVNKKMVEAMGLPFGVTHAEYKYKDGEFYLIEIAARGGGTRISSDIVPLVSGINTEEIVVDILLGKNVEVNPAPHYEYAVLGFFDFKAGKVKEISGVSEGIKLPGVRALEIEVNVGEQLVQALDDRSRCGYYIICANSEEELRERENNLKNIVKVETE